MNLLIKLKKLSKELPQTICSIHSRREQRAKNQNENQKTPIYKHFIANAVAVYLLSDASAKFAMTLDLDDRLPTVSTIHQSTIW